MRKTFCDTFEYRVTEKGTDPKNARCLGEIKEGMSYYQIEALGEAAFLTNKDFCGSCIVLIVEDLVKNGNMQHSTQFIVKHYRMAKKPQLRGDGIVRRDGDVVEPVTSPRDNVH